jgi:membrane-bound lytic murein transglycosylase MltF
MGLGGAAVVIVLQQGSAEGPSMPMPRASEVFLSAPQNPVPAPQPRAWSLWAGGWYIRVDGAEVAIPSLEEVTASRPRVSLATTISSYDYVIARHAVAEGFDWRLIAALIFEESRFDPTSRSEKGALGLMQVRPIAAEAVGADRFRTPDDNVRTGTRYLRQLDDMFQKARGRDRLSLVLAAYNMGPGHVRDAQTLARRFGYDPNRWQDSMDLMLPLLEDPRIAQQLPSGAAKGQGTVAYVERILERYRRYKMTAPEVESDTASSSEDDPANG